MEGRSRDGLDQIVIDPVLDRPVETDDRLGKIAHIVGDLAIPVQRRSERLIVDAVSGQSRLRVGGALLLDER